jgi:FixJ family two-component response regulator
VGEGTKPIIYIVDDDESVLRAMKRLISSMDMDVQTFASGREFLDSGYRDQNACLIVDVKMPGMSGMELQQKLVAKGSKLPVVFVTAFDTEEVRDGAKKAGAAGYFRKPVDDQALLDSIQWALSNQPS